MTNCNKTGIFFISIMLALTACTSGKKEDKTIQGYDLSKPERFNMPESLAEISGISFYKGIPDTIYAIQDEEGKLFRLAWGIKKQYHSKFAKKGDYEDLAILHDKVIILKSSGSLFTFPFRDAVYEEIDSVKEWKDIIPKAEYEAIYGDETSGNLYIICKNCEADNSKDHVTGYILNITDTVYQTGTFSIDVNEIKSYTGKVKRGFRPSALAKNPVTGEWFILSAVNSLLVVADSNWKIKEACPLNSNSFLQPEGIAFDRSGNLYISSEGDDLTEGKILKFTKLFK